MSKQNNVNPSQYKTAGREHTDGPDAGDNHEAQTQHFAEVNAKTKQGDRNFIPGAAPVGATSESKKKK